MTTWNEFAAAAPELAAAGRALLEPTGIGEGLLATVRDDLPPRIHPVKAAIVDGRLLTFVIVGSAKTRDLDEDGRYALHAHLDPAAPDEFLVRGRATRGHRPALARRGPRGLAVRGRRRRLPRSTTCRSSTPCWAGEPTADDWPPVYTSWKPEAD